MAVPIVAAGVYQNAVMAIDRNLLLPQNVEVAIPYERHPEGFFLSPLWRNSAATDKGPFLLDNDPGHFWT
jgi:hypothetical protein